MLRKKVFVTVGTTSFDKLIEQVQTDTLLNKLKELGYSEVTLQIGNGNIRQRFPSIDIRLKYVNFVDDFKGTVKEADLVISHGGAGSCLEVLRCGKPLIVVINEDLMGNHQLELAEQLQNEHYVYYCSCSELEKTLDKDLTCLQSYPKPSKHLFGNYLNKAMGFI